MLIFNIFVNNVFLTVYGDDYRINHTVSGDKVIIIEHDDFVIFYGRLCDIRKIILFGENGDSTIIYKSEVI